LCGCPAAMQRLLLWKWCVLVQGLLL
jgi:hypothetical protein